MKIIKPSEQGQLTEPERVTINLTPRSATGMYVTMERTGDSKTDVINRHIQEGSFLEDLIARGGRVFLQEPDENEMTRLTILI